MGVRARQLRQAFFAPAAPKIRVTVKQTQDRCAGDCHLCNLYPQNSAWFRSLHPTGFGGFCLFWLCIKKFLRNRTCGSTEKFGQWCHLSVMKIWSRVPLLNSADSFVQNKKKQPAYFENSRNFAYGFGPGGRWRQVVQDFSVMIIDRPEHRKIHFDKPDRSDPGCHRPPQK
eukprot:g77031.t1